MNNELVKFTNAEFGSVRVMVIDGDLWFVGKDVANALGYKNERKALRDHVPDRFKLTERIVTSGQRREVTLINEAGMYKLVLRSKLPSAEKFSDWVCEDVLVNIRKTGTYSINRDERWQQTRLGTKKTHKPFTAAINLLIRHLESRGNKFQEDGYYYGHTTNIIQNACDIVKGGRDNASIQCLNKCEQCQQMVANLILNLIATGNADTYELVEVAILQQLNALNQLLGGQVKLLGKVSS